MTRRCRKSASVAATVDTLREENGDDEIVYVCLLVVAGPDELHVLADLTGDIAPRHANWSEPPPARGVPRRRR
jgi:hypothetical protein